MLRCVCIFSSDQYLKPLHTLRSPHPDSLDQEGRAGSARMGCTEPHAHGGGTIGQILLHSSGTKAFHRQEQIFFAFDTQILPIRHRVNWKESLTERWPHCGIRRFKKSKFFHIWSKWHKCPSNAAMDLCCTAFNLVMHFKSSAGICNQKEDKISFQITLH